MDTYLTRAEACERLRISRETFRKLVHTGQIPVHRTGKAINSHFRVSERAIAEYLERQQAVKAS